MITSRTPIGGNPAWKKLQLWQERDGTVTPISQLRTSHIEFILKMMDRLHSSDEPWREDQRPFLEEELAYRRSLQKRLDSNQQTT